MRNDIRDKLRQELLKEIKTEAQVVYILSRIRKIIEIDGNKDEFNRLKFYCDWALHARIHNTKPFKDILKSIANNPNDDPAGFLSFIHFENELKSFLHKEKMNCYIFENESRSFTFKKILYEIYSDTPLVLKDGKKVTTLSMETAPLGQGRDYKINLNILETVSEA